MESKKFLVTVKEEDYLKSDSCIEYCYFNLSCEYFDCGPDGKCLKITNVVEVKEDVFKIVIDSYPDLIKEPNDA